MAQQAPWILVLQSALSGAPDFTLPDANTSIGKVIVVKSDVGRGACIVRAQARQLIDNAETYTVPTGKAASFQARNGEWKIVATYTDASGGGAPSDAEYIVGALHAGLSAERLVTDTATVTWDLTFLGQARANVPSGVVTPAPHAASHQNGGSDEINVAGLSGQLADRQLVRVQDEGIDQGTVDTLNFAGAGVTAVVGAGVATMTISGGAGAGWTIVETNVGSTPITSGRFTIVDASISGSSKVIVQQAPGPYTGKGTLADEAAMDPLWCVAAPGSGSAVVHWRTMQGVTLSPRLGDFGRGPTILAAPQDDPQARLSATVIGKVRGNVKFQYTVA